MEEGQFSIRRARHADAMAIAAVQVACWRQSYAGLIPSKVLDATNVPEQRARHASRLGDPHHPTATFVATRNGGPVVGFGVCGAARSGPSGVPGEFQALYVLKDHGGNGVGSGLMAIMAGWLQCHALEPAYVRVLRDNRAARRFYEHRGGSQVSEQPFLWRGARLIDVTYGWSDLDIPMGLAREEEHPGPGTV